MLLLKVFCDLFLSINVINGLKHINQKRYWDALQDCIFAVCFFIQLLCLREI